MTERFKRLGVAIATALLLVPTVSAKQYLNEDFAYPAGDLYNQGGWLKFYSNRTEAPIQIGAPALTYPGYQDAAKGSAVTISGNNNGKDQRLWKEFSPKGITSGACYASMLINVTDAQDKFFPFAFIKPGYAGFADEKTGREYARLVIEKGSADGKYKVSVGKGSNNGTYVADELDLGKTYLMVVKYDFTNDKTTESVSIYVNPTTF